MKDILSVFAGVLAIFAIVPYVKDIIRGKTKPNVVSWFTWSLLLIIATLAAFAAHQPRTALLSLGDLIGTATILILGLKFGRAKFSWLDGICQIGALAGLLLWFIFNSPTIAIVATIFIDFIAAVPTLRHSWISPSEETWQTFFMLCIASIITLFSLDNLSFTGWAFPVYLLLINALIMSTVVLRNKKD